MPVDKFGENGGIVAQFSTAGLVHKTGDTMLGILSMRGFRLTNVGDPTASTATKGYADTVDQDNLQLSGGTMRGNLFVNAGSDIARLLGCIDLTSGQGFTLALGNLQNKLHFAVIAPPKTQTPLTLETTHGFLVQAANQDVCQLGNAGAQPTILIHKNITMNSHSIKQLPNPLDDQDAATKIYVDTAIKSGTQVQLITARGGTTQLSGGSSDLMVIVSGAQYQTVILPDVRLLTIGSTVTIVWNNTSATCQNGVTDGAGTMNKFAFGARGVYRLLANSSNTAAGNWILK